MVHNLFLDVSIFKGVSSIQKVIDSAAKATSEVPAGLVHESRVGDLSITVKRDEADASLKRELKIVGSKMGNESVKEVSQRNLLKGVTADESVVVHVSNFYTHNSILTVKPLYFKMRTYFSLLHLEPDLMSAEQKIKEGRWFDALPYVSLERTLDNRSTYKLQN